jgi:uncharacterized protein (DUF2252 family)
MAAKDPKSANAVADEILRYNAGRDPERLAMKFARMAQSPFVFLRGACHLFYEALPDSPLLRAAPTAWNCGDLHFENFGSYKGDNRLVYFDINDYDESALAPASWDLLRLLVSIQCGADVLNATADQAMTVSRACLDAYRAALVIGKPLWVERETSGGLVRDLLTSLQKTDRSAFLDRRTVRTGKKRSLRIDGAKALAASDAQKAAVAGFMRGFAAAQPNPGFFEVIDIARRVAGTGSLGIDRYVVLVEGKGSPDGNYLLDIKAAGPAALAAPLARLGIAQPAWPDEASRVVAIQRRMQAVDHAFLQPVKLGNRPYILKGLQASEDRVAIGDWGRKLERLQDVVATMGRILAWDQLRAAGRGGAAGADALADFVQGKAWAQQMLDAATQMAQTTARQWQAFVDARKADGARIDAAG